MDVPSFIPSLAGAIIGGFISAFTTCLLYRAQRKDAYKKEIARHCELRGEFKVDPLAEDNDLVPHIKTIFTSYKMKRGKNGLDFILPKSLKNTKQLKTKYIYLRNIGKSTINQLDICVASPDKCMLIPEDSINDYVSKGLASFSVLEDTRIFVNDLVCLKIKYQKNAKIINLFSSSLEIVYMDELHECYAQPLFPEQDKLYEARRLDQKEYNRMVRTSSIIKSLEEGIE